jgi:enoyl-CoA hydratase/carnithine racemase
MTNASADILYEPLGHVRLITINRPSKMNSMNFEANDALCDIWRTFRDDEDARVAVITGAGDQAFCAGADLKQYTMSFARTPTPEFRRRFTNGPGFGGITRNLNVFKPIIAAVNGPCMRRRPHQAQGNRGTRQRDGVHLERGPVRR